MCVPAVSVPSEPEKFTPEAALNGPDTLTAVPSIRSVEPATPFGLATFQLILPFACGTVIWLMVGPTPAMGKLPLTLEVLLFVSVAVMT